MYKVTRNLIRRDMCLVAGSFYVELTEWSRVVLVSMYPLLRLKQDPTKAQLTPLPRTEDFNGHETNRHTFIRTT